MSTTLYQGWNHRTLGTGTIEWTDDDGAHSASITSATNSGKLSHIDLSAVNLDTDAGGTTDLEFHALATELQTVMDAATAQTVTVAFSQSTLAYTITVSGASFTAINWPGAAGLTLRRMLGMSVSAAPAAGVLTSDITPRYIWRAAVDGRAAYNQPAAIEGQTISRRAGSMLYTIGPSQLVREARWEHRFESKTTLHRRFATAEDWTAESFVDHATKYAMPCVVVDSTESMVFYSGRGWVRDAFARSRPDSDTHQTFRVTAESIVGYL